MAISTKGCQWVVQTVTKGAKASLPESKGPAAVQETFAADLDPGRLVDQLR
ncbi:hypothetical protein [Streptomyces canus]|uniref:hypothetical protein n=1 Tax=Streptomyces canus TaxID=58343 RepID=UPI002DDC2D36|nr:hypothetical protein [Streptomyces canus]WSD89709.1 hypothetical protein OG925_37805 [Streptomyces canus]